MAFWLNILFSIVVLLVLLLTFSFVYVVCDKHLVPSVEVFVNNYRIPEDVAAVTLIALGNSSPELLLNMIGVAQGSSDLTLPDILGSAMCAFGLVPGLALLCNTALSLELLVWPIVRETSFYLTGLAIFMYSIKDGAISFYDALALVTVYITYVVTVIHQSVYRGKSANKGFISGNLHDSSKELASFGLDKDNAETDNISFNSTDESHSIIVNHEQLNVLHPLITDSFETVESRDNEEKSATFYMDPITTRHSYGNVILANSFDRYRSIFYTNLFAFWLLLEYLIDSFLYFIIPTLQLHAFTEPVRRRSVPTVDSGYLSYLKFLNPLYYMSLIPTPSVMTGVYYQPISTFTPLMSPNKPPNIPTNQYCSSDFVSIGNNSPNTLGIYTVSCQIKENSENQLEFNLDSDEETDDIISESGVLLSNNTLETSTIYSRGNSPHRDTSSVSALRAGVVLLSSITLIALAALLVVQCAGLLVSLLGLDSETVGATLVALGGEVPDAVNSVVLARHGLHDAAMASALGSQVVNICMGVGLSALLACALSEDGSGLLINVEEGDSLLLLAGLLLVVVASFIFAVMPCSTSSGSIRKCFGYSNNEDSSSRSIVGYLRQLQCLGPFTELTRPAARILLVSWMVLYLLFIITNK